MYYNTFKTLACDRKAKQVVTNSLSVNKSALFASADYVERNRFLANFSLVVSHLLKLRHDLIVNYVINC